ncbi:MAG: FtsX-like permease family protein [Clostridium sp.]|uniref:ABC transporter permease n=1 Tax=Clostridium sp. TaxID=1506 RepID=UPI003037DFD1
MYSKIAINNVKKSFKDYSIYFLTLTFAVCIFYSFNSIESQKAILDLNSSQESYMDMLNSVISIVSVFVSLILGSLIVYANNFLIKKRKKELGIYMTLGMSKKKISRILLIETFIIGLISLVIGLLLGIALSQGLSVFTGKLFDVSMTEFKFIISTAAIAKTGLYFGIIFLLVMLFNTGVISKYKLIDLLTASKKNQSIKLKSPIVSMVIFISGLIMLGVAYYLSIKSGLDFSDIKLNIAIGLGVSGTGTVFYGLAGFVLYVVKSSEKLYLKNLNIFISRQISSKINTNFVSMTVICLMLFITVGMLSTGLSFKSVLEKGLESTTPYDASAKVYIDYTTTISSAEKELTKIGLGPNEDVEMAGFTTYKFDTSFSSIIGKYADDYIKKMIDTGYWENTYAVKVSEFNNIRKLDDKNTFELNNNEVLITSNSEKVIPALNELIESGETINIDGKEYTIKNTEIIKDSFTTSGFADNTFTIVLPDESLAGAKVYDSNVNINFVGEDKVKLEEKYAQAFKGFREGKLGQNEEDLFVLGYTRDGIIQENKGMVTIVLFIGIYLGVVFLISSAAVLALQQLSEASDSIDRYKVLKKIGASKKMINKTIFVQTLILFMLPLSLALVHSVVGIKVVNDFLTIYNKPDIGGSAAITVFILVVIYGGYFYSTYVGYKSIVNSGK